ncbi:MAG: hypothetical protein EBT57_01630 [Verrucomicrobia bacterium]|nr:hypothetical protein [Verrucomicrobiota bacterium]
MRAIRLVLGLTLAWATCWGEFAPQPVAFRVGPLLFDRPEGWRWVKPEGSLRAAQLEKSGLHPTPLVMAFSLFPAGSGGSVQANIERWIRQFSRTSYPAEVKSIPLKSCPHTLVKIRGSLKGGLPGGPEKEIPDALLLGAILEVDGEMIVVKTAGPASALSGEEKVFAEMISVAAERRP